MKKLARALSVVMFAALSAFLLWFGYVYSSVSEPLWFHAAAIPADAQDAVRPLYFALMTLIGAASMALGGICLYLTLFGVTRRMAGAGEALAAAFSTVLIMAGLTAEKLADATGAPTSWNIMLALLAATLTAYVLDVATRRASKFTSL